MRGYRQSAALPAPGLPGRPEACCGDIAADAHDAENRVRWGQRLTVFLLLFYKSALSPMLPSSCKFYPSCSVYAKEAVERHGVRHGLRLALRRLLRCRPFAPGGYDPVPDA